MTVMKILWTSGFLLLFNAMAAATMQIRSFQALRHSRFYAGADKAFIGDPYDWSGVGRASSSGTWATLVSDNYFISATHYHPGAGGSVTFWKTNSLADPSYTYTVAGGQQIGGTDLWVGWFNSAVNASIERYPVLGLASPADYLNLVQYNYGVDHRLGLNVTEGYWDDQTVDASTGFVWAADYDNNDAPSVGGDETFLQGGDSGAPTFNVVSGQLALIGIHWAISDEYPNTNEGEIFVDSAVPAYITEINGVLAARGQELMVIPEPSGTLMLCCILVLGAATTRRRP
jgi:hypothetical protein